MVLAMLGLSIITACNASGPRSSQSVLHLYTPATANRTSPRVTLLSLQPSDVTNSRPHFVRESKPFAVSLPALTTLQQAHAERPRMQLASTTTLRKQRSPLTRKEEAARTELNRAEFPMFEFERGVPAANDFYVTLGTGVVDPEKDPSWLNAAVYPQVPTTRALPSMRVMGQSARSNDHLQVAPGFFWWASNACCLSLSVPVRVTGTASDWGVLFALNY